MRVGSLGSGGGGWTASLEGCPGTGGGLACEERGCVCLYYRIGVANFNRSSHTNRRVLTNLTPPLSHTHTHTHTHTHNNDYTTSLHKCELKAVL